MALLRTSAQVMYQRVLTDDLARDLAEELRGRYRECFLKEPPHGEVEAWRSSLPDLARVLRDADLPEVEVLIEHRLPLTSLRADVVLAGRHPQTRKPSYVVVELKQWRKADMVPDTDDLCRTGGSGNTALLHPVAQVARYCDYLADFTALLGGDRESVAGFAYLHRADNRDVAELLAFSAGRHRQLFTRTSRGALIRELQLRLSPTGGALPADRLLDSSTAPSTPLMRAAADEIAGHHRYRLLDEQQVAVSLVKRAVELSHRLDTKEAIVISGGPGSGKSVIALHLLGALAQDGRTVVHATGSRSFTGTLRHYLAGHEGRVGKLFRFFLDFSRATPNRIDVLICDEAHRIREVSSSSRRPQVMELLDAARVPVFLLDDYQGVRPDEIASVEGIRQAAISKGITVRKVSLSGQFRNGGSEAYDHWVLRFLGLLPGGPLRWEGDDRFQLVVAESPQEMEELLRARHAKGETARMTAGFCWKWSDPSKGRLINDVKIEQWHRPWNLRGGTSAGGAPRSDLWATDPAGFGQIGCVYTAQGFEYAWNGVIMGPDLVWRQGRWRPQQRASRDGQLTGTAPETFARLVRNVYKVLLTRGMAGTVLYSTDPETRAMMRELVSPRGLSDAPPVRAASL